MADGRRARLVDRGDHPQHVATTFEIEARRYAHSIKFGSAPGGDPAALVEVEVVIPHELFEEFVLTCAAYATRMRR